MITIVREHSSAETFEMACFKFNSPRMQVDNICLLKYSQEHTIKYRRELVQIIRRVIERAVVRLLTFLTLFSNNEP